MAEEQQVRGITEQAVVVLLQMLLLMSVWYAWSRKKVTFLCHADTNAYVKCVQSTLCRPNKHAQFVELLSRRSSRYTCEGSNNNRTHERSSCSVCKHKRTHPPAHHTPTLLARGSTLQPLQFFPGILRLTPQGAPRSTLRSNLKE
mmetsp:Transcript_56859/g.83429  ORF Transcript_56859/g.83429 Transcript_56859/m.83429 type:complete len:145 (+) Transcript_56859:351-785(+)